MKQRVLVTGTVGFLGKNVAEFLERNGLDVLPFDQKTGQDLLEEKDLEKALSKVDFVCHLAAVGDVYLAAENPKEAAIAGVAGTANLAKTSQKYKIKKIIYASTWEVYGEPKYQPIDEKHPANPDHPYSISKYAGELMLKSKLFNVPWTILRLGTSYGPYMRKNAVIPAFINLAKAGKTIKIQGTGKQTRAFINANDVANAFYLAIKSNVKNEIFNITGTELVSILDLAKLITQYHPTKIEFTEARTADVPSSLLTSEKAKKMLTWEAKIPFKKGLEELLKL